MTVKLQNYLCCNLLYCIFVLLGENIADRTQQMEQVNITKVKSQSA